MECKGLSRVLSNTTVQKHQFFGDHPHGKEMQKSKMAVWGGLINSCEKKRSECKAAKKRYKHLNAEFQRIARRDKKAFLSHQGKEIEKNTEWERLEISSRKLEMPREQFHAKMGSIKDRNGMDLTEAEDIKKRGQENTGNCTKKIFKTKIITMV